MNDFFNSNTSVEQYYMVDNATGLDGYYYLNTFENILVSGGRNYYYYNWLITRQDRRLAKLNGRPVTDSSVTY